MRKALINCSLLLRKYSEMRFYNGMNPFRSFATFLLLVLSFSLTAIAGPAPKDGKYFFYVGTYTGNGSSSKGIYVYRYDAATQEITSLGLAAETTSPSFIAPSPNGRFVYAVNELGDYKGPNSGGVSAFSIDKATGKLTFLNEVQSRGAGPCYITVDRTGKWVLVANYDGGSNAVFPVLADGKLGEASSFVQHTGHGADPKRQEAPHAHSIDLSLDNRFAYVDDLGLDELLVYKFDASKGTLTPNDPPYAKLDPGSGPRHFALASSGKFAYVVSEIKGTVTVFSNDPNTGKLSTLQTVSTQAEGFKGEIEDAEVEIHPSGKFLYASNRGDGNSIAVFAIDAAKGTLTPVEVTPTQGKAPRHFMFDPTGTLLLAENMSSNNVVVFRIDQKTGKLTPTGKTFEVGQPVCLKFLAAE
ncbi:MAG: lactonase family protein [Candidatus Sulfotelmatobacter sp.]